MACQLTGSVLSGYCQKFSWLVAGLHDVIAATAVWFVSGNLASMLSIFIMHWLFFGAFQAGVLVVLLCCGNGCCCSLFSFHSLSHIPSGFQCALGSFQSKRRISLLVHNAPHVHVHWSSCVYLTICQWCSLLDTLAAVLVRSLLWLFVWSLALCCSSIFYHSSQVWTFCNARVHKIILAMCRAFVGFRHAFLGSY